MSHHHPSWYDLLGVDPAASADKVRAAWRAAIADLDPTDRRFRGLQPGCGGAPRPASAGRRTTRSCAQPSAPHDEPRTPGRPQREQPDRRPPPRPRPGAPGRAAGSCRAGCCVASRCSPRIAGGRPASWPHHSPRTPRSQESTRDAQSAAERAIVPILSYDAAAPRRDQQAAESYLTADYRKKYDQLFEVIKQNAPRTKTVVTAEVVASGVVRSGDDRVVGAALRQPADHQQADGPTVAGRLQGPGHRAHAEGRRLLAGRLPGHHPERPLRVIRGRTHRRDHWTTPVTRRIIIGNVSPRGAAGDCGAPQVRVM